ncbi:MAG: hypothetical protein ACTSWN_16005 [Promethearchaeota archaeon]
MVNCNKFPVNFIVKVETNIEINGEMNANKSKIERIRLRGFLSTGR